MPVCGGTEFVPCLMAFPIVMANFAATTECKTPKRRNPNPERRHLLERLNAQVLDEAERVSHHNPDSEDEVEILQSVEVNEEGVVALHFGGTDFVCRGKSFGLAYS